MRWSYGELRRRADDLAAGLIGLGLAAGDRIGIWSPNNSRMGADPVRAPRKAGLILVNINPAYRVHEFDYAINKVGCRALILSPGFKGNDYFAALRALAPELDTAAPGRLKAARLPQLEIVIRLGADKTAGASISTTSPRRRDRAPKCGARGARQARCSSTIRSTSSSLAAPPARPRARR